MSLNNEFLKWLGKMLSVKYNLQYVEKKENICTCTNIHLSSNWGKERKKSTVLIEKDSLYTGCSESK